MLQSIRDNTQGWLTNAVIGLLIIVFVIWCIHGFLELNSENGDKVIAKAAGQTLLKSEFDRYYQRFYRQAQGQLATESLSKEIINQLKKQIIEEWTLMQLLAYSAKQENYRLSQSAVNSALLNIPIFQSSGRFSSTQFYNVLNAIGYTKSQFLIELKQKLLIDQLQQGLVETEFSLPGEIKNFIELIQQKRDFAYAILPSSQFLAKQFVSESQAFVYYQNNKDSFTQPEQVSIEYIKLSLAALKNDKTFVEKRDKLANLTYIHPRSLETAAKTLGLPIQSTSLFTNKGGSDALTKNEKIIAAAFRQDSFLGNNSPVIDVDANTSIVLRIKQHKASTVYPFIEVKAKIMEYLKQEMASNEAHIIGEKLVNDLKKNNALAEKNKINLNWHVINSAKRNDAKLSPEIRNAVFKLPRGKKVEKTPLITGLSLPNGDYAIIKLFAIHDGDSENLLDSQLVTYGKKLEKEFGQLEYDLYMQNLIKV